MENIMLKKENGIVTKSVCNKLTSFEANEKCFSNVIKQNITDLKKSDVDATTNSIFKMIQKITNANVGPQIIGEFYNLLKIANTKDDLLEVINLLIKSCEQILLSRKKDDDTNANVSKTITEYSKQIKSNFELAISIATKKIVSTYYLNKTLSLGIDKVNELENLKISGASVETMFEYLGETFDKISVLNGIEKLSKKIFVDTIDIAFKQLQTHLCWENCTNASALQCKKIYDRVKQKIDKYDFITDGYQIFDKNGNIERFVVTGCDNYTKAQPKVYTPKLKQN